MKKDPSLIDKGIWCEIIGDHCPYDNRQMCPYVKDNCPNIDFDEDKFECPFDIIGSCDDLYESLDSQDK